MSFGLICMCDVLGAVMSIFGKKLIKCNSNALQYCKLSKVSVPSDVDEDDIISVRELVSNSYILSPGEKLCRAGEPLNNLYAVLSGSAKSTITSINGSEVITDFYFPGEIIGLDAVSNRMYSFEAITLEESLICIIPFEKLLTLAAKIPQLQDHFIYVISQKLLDRTRILINNHRSAEQRVAAFIANIIFRYEYCGLPSNNYRLSMSRYDIGNYLNLTPETISRTFSKFHDSGILSVRKKHICLINGTELKKIQYNS